MKQYTVWVGGVEVNDHLLTLEEAIELSVTYTNKGYTDVGVQKVNNDGN